MEHTVATDIEQLAASVQQPVEQVRRVMELLDAGFSIAYLARYRCEDVGGLDESSLSQLALAIGNARRLAERKQVVLRGIANQNQLTDEVEQAVRGAVDLRQLEDIYLPFKRRKRAKEEIERRDAAAPLVRAVLAADLEVDVETSLAALATTYSVEDLGRGLRQMIGEQFLQQTAVRNAVRQELELHSVLVSEQFHEPEEEFEGQDDTAEHDDSATMDVDQSAHDQDEGSEPAAAVTTSEPAADAESRASAESSADDEAPVEEAPRAASEPSESAVPSESSESSESAVPSESAEGKTIQDRATGAVQKLRRAALSVAELRREQRREARQKRRRRLAATFRPFFQFRKTVAKISPSEWTSLDQGERLRVLSIHYDFRWEPLAATCEPLAVPSDHPHRDLLRQCFRDGLQREAEVLAREVQRELVARAELRCLDGQCLKLQRLLLRRPMPVPVLAIEPKIRRESTLVVLDALGKLVKEFALNLSGGETADAARQQLRTVLADHGIEHIAVGDNPGWKDTVHFLATWQTGQDSGPPIRWTLIRSGGTSLRARGTSTSRDLQMQPEHVRRAVSIGRRLQNPLVEYTRVEAERLARLLFSEETKSELFDRRMEHAVRSSIAQTGVNVNEADETLLRYVPGLNQLYAQKIVLARKEAGRFASRQAILEIPGIDAQALQQAVAFLMVPGSENPFDVTPVHPSHERCARSLLTAGGITADQFAEQVQAATQGQAHARPTERETSSDWANALREVDVAALATELGVNPQMLSAVRDQLLRSTAWTRQHLAPPPFSEHPLEWSEIRRSQPVVGTVTNIVPFGAFVDLGHGVVGLLHVSRLSEHFVADPRELIDEGEQLSLWVGDVDSDKQKISLSFIPPAARESTSYRSAHTARPPQRSPRSSAGAGRRGQPAGKGPPRRPKRPAAPVLPITEAMKDGKEPMRTFSDLLQFYEHQQKGGEAPPRSKDKRRND